MSGGSRGGEGGYPGASLDQRDRGQRRHLHAGGENDRLGGVQVELVGEINKVHRVESADGPVVGHTEADGIDNGGPQG